MWRPLNKTNLGLFNRFLRDCWVSNALFTFIHSGYCFIQGNRTSYKLRKTEYLSYDFPAGPIMKTTEEGNTLIIDDFQKDSPKTINQKNKTKQKKEKKIKS